MPDNSTLREMHRQMVRIRIFEETLVEVYMEGKTPAFDIAAGPVPGEMHLAAGQEPVAAGVCAHLRPDRRDHRDPPSPPLGPRPRCGHEDDGRRDLRQGRPASGTARAATCTCSSASPPSAAAASSGRASRPPCGHALAFKKMGRDDIAVSFFGEGAANQGSFHESLNLAALWDLGVVFVCEDNDWAISVPKEAATAIANNSDRAARLRDPGRPHPGQRPGRDLRGRRRGRRASPPRRRAVPDRDQDGPASRALPGRRAALPDRRADRGAGAARRDPPVRGAAGLLAARSPSRRSPTSGPRCRAEVEEAIQFARDAAPPAPEFALDHVFA